MFLKKTDTNQKRGSMVKESIMTRKDKLFPLNEYAFLCSFLKYAWEQGWLDEYSEEHFLIKAIESRLDNFVGKDQLTNVEINLHGIVNPAGKVNMQAFCLNFCINFSNKIGALSNHFGEENIKRFMLDQMSAGKNKYDEDSFFQALSEISILSFYAQRFPEMSMIYEPAVDGKKGKNPEAKFTGNVSYTVGGKIIENKIAINIEVKSPKFPHDNHENEITVIPTMLLTDNGREEIKNFCDANAVVYMPPRVKKLCDFINSAVEKFAVPGENEYNILYINWSYRDFPSNGFLEAWSLLTNSVNGIFTNKQIANKLGVSLEAFSKISAVVVYTESIEGLMFSDFRHVWQHAGAGHRFRMWIINDDQRNKEIKNEIDIFLQSRA